MSIEDIIHVEFLEDRFYKLMKHKSLYIKIFIKIYLLN